jgi:hypothetical protein
MSKGVAANAAAIGASRVPAGDALDAIRGGRDMALTIKKVTLWRNEFAHQPGALADVLEPLAAARANLRVLMGYAFPGDPSRAAIEVFPITGRKAKDAAGRGGLVASPISCLLVEGDDRAGLGAQLARAIAVAGVNISFVMAESIGRKFSAIFGFADDADAARATNAIKAAVKSNAAAKPARRSIKRGAKRRAKRPKGGVKSARR